jgi:NAD(P)-dependent dehydrogenase (short-subunit alcohol dehydrogenase family)
VIVAGRTREKIEAMVDEITARGGQAEAAVCDVTNEASVHELFTRVDASGPGSLDLLCYNAGNNRPHDFASMTAEFFEDVWKVACLGGFLCGREAVRRMLPAGRGTIMFTGASASLRGKPTFAAFSAGKSGLRAVAQSMAREFGPQGIHVAHVVVDGSIDGDRIRMNRPERVLAKGEDGLLDLEGIADTFAHIHAQPRSAWTHETDLRPYKEPF